MVVPAELKEVLVSWQRWALGLEGLAFIQVALGVERRLPGRGFEGKFGLGARSLPLGFAAVESVNVGDDVVVSTSPGSMAGCNVLQPQIIIGRMELLQEVGEVRWWQRTETKWQRWPGGPRALRECMGA